MVAAQNGHIETIRTLISNGAKMNIVDEDGWAPWRTAASNKHIDVAEFLMSNMKIMRNPPLPNELYQCIKCFSIFPGKVWLINKVRLGSDIKDTLRYKCAKCEENSLVEELFFIEN